MMHAIALQLAVLWFSFWGIDIQAAQEAAQGTAQIILPPTAPALPEETAWSMIYAEGGVLALLLAIGLLALWRVVKSVLEESRAQNRELMRVQVEAIAKLAEGVQEVRNAVKDSDKNNQHALSKLSDMVAQTIARLDKHEARLEQHTASLMHHSTRLGVLESRRTPPSTPVNPKP